MEPEYEWDEDKNRSNRAKHGIRFETAIEVFSDDFELTEFDQFVDGETRWRTIGMVQNYSVLLVIYTERGPLGQIIRIISARAATKPEVKRYEQSRRKDR